MHQLYELPIPKLSVLQKKKLAEFAGKLLKNPRDVKERAASGSLHRPRALRPVAGRLEASHRHVHLRHGESKAELDEIIRQSHALWGTVG